MHKGPTDPSVDDGEQMARELLVAHQAGDTEALARVFELVYKELRKLAHYQRANAPKSDTLNTTGLVHEVYLKLSGAKRGFVGDDREHFINIAAQAMRQVLVDGARGRMTIKRGSGERPVPLEEADQAVQRHAELLIDLDRALEKLARTQPRVARVFACRYFAGLSPSESAAAAGVSLRTAERDWLEARRSLRGWLSSSLAMSDEEFV